MSAQVYSVPGQTNGRRKAFLEWTGIDSSSKLSFKSGGAFKYYKKKGRQRQKRKDFNKETIKRLSPRSKYYCFSDSRASRIRKFYLSANLGGRQYFSVFHGPPTLKSILSALIRALKKSEKLHFDGLFWSKAYNVLATKLNRDYVS